MHRGYEVVADGNRPATLEMHTMYMIPEDVFQADEKASRNKSRRELSEQLADSDKRTMGITGGKSVDGKPERSTLDEIPIENLAGEANGSN